MALTPEQLAAYDRDGFVRLDGVFAPEEVRLLRAEAVRLGRADRPTQDGNVYEKNSGRVRMSYALEADSPAFAACYRLPRILGPVTRLLGEDIYQWQGRLIHKLARHGELWQWHQDYVSWNMDGAPRGGHRDMVSVLILLDDSVPENGPVRFVRGSHRLPPERATGVLDWNYDDTTTSYPVHTVRRIEEIVATSDVVDALGPAGTVYLFAPLTIHSSTNNTSARDRHNLYFVYSRMDNMPAPGPSKREKITNRHYLNFSRQRLTAVTDAAFERLARETAGRAVRELDRAPA